MAGSFDYRKLQKYLNPQAAAELNTFLEEMPLRAGYALIAAASIAWLIAGCAIVFATVKAGELAEVRKEFQEAEALQPIVPIIREEPISAGDVANFVLKMNDEDIYKNLKIEAKGSTITIMASDGVYFGAFREAIGHLFNGGRGWRLDIQNLCVGSECRSEKGRQFLTGSFTVHRLRVDNPS